MKRYAARFHRASSRVLTQQQHCALPFVSNTDLSRRLADELLGRPIRECAAAFAFGSYFHSATLEPHLFTPTNLEDALDHRQRQQAAALATAIRRRRYPRHVLYLGEPEQSYTATHEATGLTVKVRPDLFIDSPKGKRRTLVDFKTTSCRDLTQFLETVDKYGYNRQGALYADALSAHRVVLIAVQKRPLKSQPPAVWVHELTTAQMPAGHKKYTHLLRACAELGSPLSAPASHCATPLQPA